MNTITAWWSKLKDLISEVKNELSSVNDGLAAVRNGTAKKTEWGINLGTVYCPRCNAPQPRVRRPQNRRQALWGGSTCSCGCEMDKWGREITSDSASPGTPGPTSIVAPNDEISSAAGAGQRQQPEQPRNVRPTDF
jgi:hypothetical protein